VAKSSETGRAFVLTKPSIFRPHQFQSLYARFIGGEADSEQALQALVRQLGGLSNF